MNVQHAGRNCVREKRLLFRLPLVAAAAAVLLFATGESRHRRPQVHAASTPDMHTW